MTNPKPPPKLESSDYQKMWDEAHRLVVNTNISPANAWFEAVWNYLIRNKFEITDPPEKKK